MRGKSSTCDYDIHLHVEKLSARDIPYSFFRTLMPRVSPLSGPEGSCRRLYSSTVTHSAFRVPTKADCKEFALRSTGEVLQEQAEAFTVAGITNLP